MPDTGTTTAFEAGYQAGQSIGVLIVCLLIFLPALHCFLIFRRPATNAKCVLSLGILTSSILLAAIIGVATRNHPNLIWLGGVAGLALFAALIGAIVLAIIGLVEYHGRKGQYNQGKIHAIITLALCSLFFCLMILGAYKGFEKARLRAGELKTQQSKPDEWLTFEDMNFRFKVPPKPWVQLNAKKLNTNCTVAFMNARPEVYVMVIPEKVGDGQISTDSLVEIVIAKLRSNASSVRILKQTPDTRHGLNGVQLEVTARAANYDLRYGFWMCATNGYLYQVIAYGRSDQADAVREKSEEMFSRFELIDYQRVAPRRVNVASKDFQSTNFQYSVRMAHSAFRPSPTMARSVPAAEFCAWDETSSVGVFVIPVFMMDQHPELEALTQALLGLMEISYPNDDISHEKQITEGNLKGIGFNYERVNSYGKYSYRIKVLKGQGYGYLAGAFDLPKGKDDAKILEEALARVEFPTEPAPPVKSQDFNSRERDRHALVFNQLGLFYYKTRHYENSATYFKLAFEFDRKNSIYLQNFLNASSNLGRHREALDYLEDNPATLAASRQLRAAQAFLELQLQQTDQAVTNFAAVFAEGYQNDDYFTQYINLLSQTKQQDVAIVAVEKYLEQKDSLTVRLLQAHLYSQKKEYTKAINLLKVQREKFPFNSELSLALADDLFHSGLYRESVEICQRLTDDQTDSGAVFYLKGCGEFGLKRYREAKTSFEIALKKIPNSPEVKSYLELVSGMLGEGSNTALKEVIAPVAIPEKFLSEVPAAPPASYVKDYGAQYVKQIVAISFVKKKEFKRTDYFQIKVLDASGISAFSTIQFVFDPLSQGIFVNDLKIKDASGKVLATGNVSDYYVVDNNSSSIASQKKILNIPVSGLQPDCVIDLTVTRQDLAPPEEFPFITYNFSTTFPVLRNILFIRGDIDSLKFAGSAEGGAQKTDGGIYWMEERPAVYRWEPLQPVTADFLPAIYVGDGSVTWAAQAKKYLETIGDHLQLDASQGEFTAKLVKSLNQDSDKILTVARYMQSNYTYKALEFGRRARIPHKTAEIVHNQYGDCKDHALLLQQMLESAGIPSRLALVKSSGKLQKTLPSLDQFDHMVVYLPNFQNGFFLDCTDKGSDLGQAVPLGLAGKDALILDPKVPRLVTIPEYSPDSTTISSTREVQIVNATDVSVHETLSLRGYYAGYLRSALKVLQPATRRSYFDREMNQKSAEITVLKIENLDDTESPLVLQMDYVLKKQFHKIGNQIEGKIPDIWEHFYTSVDPVEQRLTPFQVAFPIALQTTINLSTPEGYVDAALPPFEQNLQGHFANSKSAAQKQAHGVKIDYNLQRLGGTFAASEYVSFRENVAKALGTLEQDVTFTRKH